MRILLVTFIFTIAFIPLSAQRNNVLGLFGGTAYYIGDVNPNMHFYRPKPSFGLLFRSNLGKHYAIRSNFFYANLSGDERDFPEIVNPGRELIPIFFNTRLIDLNFQFEFNFFPLDYVDRQIQQTPYVGGGIGYSIIFGSVSNSSNPALPHFTIPLTVGYKINFSKRFGAGAEWSFRKTISDRVDGLLNPIGIQSLINNNDWYSFIGVFITYKFVNFVADCPAYPKPKYY